LFGFNGQIQDQEWMGGQSVAFEFRTQDTRLGRFLSTDPLTAQTPWETPYAFAGNSPIRNIDWLGLSARSVNPPAGNSRTPKSGGARDFFKKVGDYLASVDPVEAPVKNAPAITNSEMQQTVQRAKENPPTNDPKWKPLTRKDWVQINKDAGVLQDIESKYSGSSVEKQMKLFYTRIGRIFEDAALESMDVEANTQRFLPFPYTNGTIPDGVDHNAVNSRRYEGNRMVAYETFYPNSVFYEVKAARVIEFEQKYNKDQFKRQMDYLSQPRMSTVWRYGVFGVTWSTSFRHLNPARVGAGVLVLVTVHDAVIDPKIIAYAKAKNLLLVHRKAYFRETTKGATSGGFFGTGTNAGRSTHEIYIDSGTILNYPTSPFPLRKMASEGSAVEPKFNLQ